MKTRRVSYVIPPPSVPPPLLSLPPLDAPRNGWGRPILIPATSDHTLDGPSPALAQHPQHRLGITALALDASTTLAGRDTPEGILYSGGRDGLIVAWEQSVPMKQRDAPYGQQRTGHWEAMTGWDEEEEDEEDEEWLDGEKRDDQGEIPYVDRWAPDWERVVHKPAQFRQSVQAHTDWINDIVLCNYNRTLVSASNDGTLKAWNPHATSASDLSPTVIGTHSDYVRCVVHSRERNWIASGSFDRSIKLWDIQSPHSLTPLTTLDLPDSSSNQKASVYALATDAAGRVIAAGSPERIVRIWDPRTSQRTAKLVGHTDNIRTLIISEDGKYLLSGSSDASIKLWSLTAQRCIHTFAHHTDSVWSLFSNHPSLEVFYSGDRSGLVCKVDVEGCNDISEGECVLVCKDSCDQLRDDSNTKARGCPSGPEGINKIVGMDDLYIWTATGSSSFKRWTVPPRRSLRAARESSMDMLSPSSPTSVDHQAWNPSRTDSPDAAASSNTSGLPFGLSSSPVLSRSLGAADPNQKRDSGLSFSELGQREESLAPAAIAPTPSRTWSHQPKLSTHSTASVTGTLYSTHTIGPSGAVGGKSGLDGMFGIPYESLIKLVSPNDPYNIGASARSPSMFVGSPYRPSQGGAIGAITSGKEPEISALYSAASVHSVPLGTVEGGGPLPVTLWNSATTSPPPSITSPRFSLGPQQTLANQQPSAREQYEDRELAVSATPLQSRPDDIVRGTSGLVKSIILNDRVHALTVDTDGEVACWDLVRGLCVGVWNIEEIGNEYAASFNSNDEVGEGGGGAWVRSNPREALEIVRERIEGEAMTPSWSTIDTKIGHLTVHVMESRGFDAEIYADEMDFLKDSPQTGDLQFPEDHKLNVGKWVLANIFSAFVQAELLLAAEFNGPAPASVDQQTTGTSATQHLQIPSDTSTNSGHNIATRPIISHSQSTSITRGSAPTHISLDLPPLSATQHGKRLRSVSDLTNAMTTKTPGLGHGTPAITPAVLDDLPPPSPVVGMFGGKNGLVKKLSGKNLNASAALNSANNGVSAPPNTVGGLSTIPGTPGTGNQTPGLTGGFSMHTGPLTATPGATSATGTATSKTPAAGSGSGAHDYFTAVVRGRGRSGSLLTSAAGDPPEGGSDGAGGGGIMGRLRNFGKPSKRPNSGDPTSAAIPEVETTTSDKNGALEVDGNELTVSGKISRPTAFVKDLAPIPPLEAPPIALPTNMAVMISEETDTGGANWDLIYHGLVGTMEEDLEEIETATPNWLVELLMRGGTLPSSNNNANGAGSLGQAPTLKISFVVVAWHKRNEPISDVSRLTASRILRVRKILQYAKEKFVPSDKLPSVSKKEPATRPSNNPATAVDPAVDLTPKNDATEKASTKEGTKPTELKAEDEFELLCNDVVLPPHMTLAVIKHYLWRSGGELTMYYRPKKNISTE